jgi:hypothetical protein
MLRANRIHAADRWTHLDIQQRGWAENPSGRHGLVVPSVSSEGYRQTFGIVEGAKRIAPAGAPF